MPSLSLEDLKNSLCEKPDLLEYISFVFSGYSRVNHANIQGKTTGFYELLQLFQEQKGHSMTANDMTLFTKCIKGLNNVVSCVTKEHFNLVDAILSLEWFLCEDSFVHAFIDFITNLTSAHPFYVVPVVRMLVNNFRYEPFDVTVHDRIHHSLKTVIKIVPSVSGYIPSVLIECFPLPNEDLSQHEIYIKSLLKLSTYVLNSRAFILDLILKNLLLLDVEIQTEFDALTDEECDAVESLLDEMDDASVVPNHHAVQFCASMHKLDSLLDILISYVDQYLKKNERQFSKIENIFFILLSIFEKNILPTFKSRYSQYVIFYICSKYSVLSDMFLGMLVSKLVNSDGTVSDVIRVASVSYIASFVARSKSLPSSSVLTCFDILLSFTDQYIRTFDEKADNLVGLNTLFYSVSQSLFYIFCFHHDLFLKDESFLNKSKKSLERLIHCKLNPFKVCQLGVVEEFARISKEYDFLYGYSILERNSRQALTFHNSFFDEFESFFPFDPIKIPLLKKFIHDQYRQWDEGDIEEERAQLAPNPSESPGLQMFYRAE